MSSPFNVTIHRTLQLTDSLQPRRLQLQHVNVEVRPLPIRVEDDLVAQPDKVPELHVVDEGAAVVPGGLTVAAQRADVDVLEERGKGGGLEGLTHLDLD